MVFLLTTVVLPILVITLLWRRPRKPAGAWLTTFVMTLGVVGFSVLVAPWGVLGVWIRHAILLLFLAALVISLRRPLDPERLPEPPIRSLVKIVIGLFFGGVAVGAVASHAAPDEALNLAFPLRGGSFLVLHGGSRPATNVHAADPKQRYAVDFVKLGPMMRRARGVQPDALDAYAIWGERVFSPCPGRVQVVIDGLPDAATAKAEAMNPGGNHVVLRCGEVDVTLAHLQRDSIVVRAGQDIAAGVPLGAVGNSGASAEPHLHVHATKDGAAVPLRFDGEWLVRNAVVRK